MHNFYAKIQKSSVMTNYFFALPRPSIFISTASKARKDSQHISGLFSKVIQQLPSKSQKLF